MRNARHVIAWTLVATALCADRSLPAAPLEPVSAQLAGRLIERLSVNFRRVLPAAQAFRPHRFGLPKAEVLLMAPVQLAGRIIACPSPFEFRLPPPVA